MNTAVVTGASGFIGSAVAKLLLEDGWKVYGTGRDHGKRPELLREKGYIPLEVGFEDYGRLKELVKEERVEAFYHFAWTGGFERASVRDWSMQLDNVRAACDAVTAAAELHAGRFIFASSVNEVESHQFLNSFPTFQSRPTCVYGSAKLVCELLCRTIAQEKGLHYNAGLIPMLYGKGNASRQILYVVISSLLRGESPKLTEGNNLYDLASLNDVARAFVAIGRAGRDGKRYYIGHRTLKTFKEWMLEIGAAIAPEVELRFGEYQDPLNMDYSLLDLDALYNDTGFECLDDFRTGIREYGDWLKAEVL